MDTALIDILTVEKDLIDEIKSLEERVEQLMEWRIHLRLVAPEYDNKRRDIKRLAGEIDKTRERKVDLEKELANARKLIVGYFADMKV